MIRPLLLLELRRQRPILLRMVLLTIIVEAVFFAAGKRSPENLLASFIGCSIGVVLIVPLGISRDKMEGTLDFICGLPVEARDIAASRFAAMSLLAMPWAGGIGALATTVAGVGSLSPVGVAAIAWLVMLLLGALATALFLAFDLESLLGAPLVGLVIATVLLPRIGRAIFPQLTEEAFRRFLTSQAAPIVLGPALVLLVCVTTVASFAISVRSLAKVGR